MRRDSSRWKNRQCRSVQSIMGATEKRMSSGVIRGTYRQLGRGTIAASSVLVIMIVAARRPVLVPRVTMGMTVLMFMVLVMLMSNMRGMVLAMAVVVVVAGVLLGALRLER